MLCTLIGAYAVLVPIVASISVAVLVGWALLVAGIVQLAHAVGRDFAWVWVSGWRLLISVLTIVAGAFILIAPLTGTLTLTVVLVAWLWAVGVTRLMAWWMTRRAERSWLTAVNGALSIALGVLIWADFPDSATWAIGLLVGIELLFAGSSLIMTALFGRRIARAAREG